MSENICFIDTTENIFEETIEYWEKINLEIKCVVKYFGLQIFLIAAFYVWESRRVDWKNGLNTLFKGCRTRLNAADEGIEG